MKIGCLLTEKEREKLQLFKEEFKQRKGMSSEELIQKLNAIPLKDFIAELSEDIKTFQKRPQ